MRSRSRSQSNSRRNAMLLRVGGVGFSLLGVMAFLSIQISTEAPRPQVDVFGTVYSEPVDRVSMPWLLAGLLLFLTGAVMLKLGMPRHAVGVPKISLKKRISNFKTRRRFSTLSHTRDEGELHLRSIIGGSDGQVAPNLKHLCPQCRAPNDEGANYCNACGAAQ